MPVVPKVIFIGEQTPIRAVVEDNDYDSTVFVAVGPKRTLADSVRTPLALDPDEPLNYVGNFTLEPEASLAEWNYQVWLLWGPADKPTRRKLSSRGVFDVAPTLDIGDNQLIETKSRSELRLQEVEKAIDELVSGRTSQYTISGNSTVMLSLGQLRKERLYLQDLVNRERRAKGLALLPGTVRNYFSTFRDY